MSEYKYLPDWLLVAHEKPSCDIQCFEALRPERDEFLEESDKGKRFFAIYCSRMQRYSFLMARPQTFDEHPLFWDEIRCSGIPVGFGNSVEEAWRDLEKRAATKRVSK